jgi:hypothetical protein
VILSGGKLRIFSIRVVSEFGTILILYLTFLWVQLHINIENILRYKKTRARIISKRRDSALGRITLATIASTHQLVEFSWAAFRTSSTFKPNVSAICSAVAPSFNIKGTVSNLPSRLPLSSPSSKAS